MCEIIESLQLLCIENIGKNLNFISTSVSELINVRYPNIIAEKILVAYLRSNHVEKINENSLKFLLNHSSLKTFTIFPKKFDNIKYFDFLNSMEFDDFQISLKKSFDLRTTENFTLKVNNLKIAGFNNNENFPENHQFFSNCFVKNSLFYNELLNYEHDSNESIVKENNLYLLVKNSSEELKNIHILSSCISENSFKKLMESIKEKTKLQDVFLNFSNFLTTRIIHDSLLPSSNTLTKLDFSFQVFSNWDFKIGNELFKSLTSLENLHFIFNDIGPGQIGFALEFFDILKNQISNTLKILTIIFHSYDVFRTPICNFLKRCQLLEEVRIEQIFPPFRGIIEVCESLIPSAKKLEKLNIQGLNLTIGNNIEKFIDLISLCSLTKLELSFYRFNKNTMEKFLKCLKNTNSQLSSIYSYYCSFDASCLELFGRYLKNFKNLQDFSFSDENVPEKYFNDICYGLTESCSTLKNLEFYLPVEYSIGCSGLVQLLERAKALRSFGFMGSLKNKSISSLMEALKLCSSTLQDIDFSFFMSENHTQNLYDLCSCCGNLERVNIGYLPKNSTFGEQFMKSLEKSKYTLCRASLLNSKCKNMLPHSMNDFPKVEFTSCASPESCKR